MERTKQIETYNKYIGSKRKNAGKMVLAHVQFYHKKKYRESN
jgi:hypothetical protein